MTARPDLFSWGSFETPGGSAGRVAAEAMNTLFEVIVASPQNDYTQQAAWAALGELQAIERDLSRFLDDSDISRLNASPRDQPVVLGEVAWQCLAVARRMHAATGGAFDVCAGSEAAMDKMLWDDGAFAAGFATDGMRVDLGGIGKGCAVDRMIEILRDWDIGPMLVHGGRSTALAVGAPEGTDGWPIALPAGAGNIELCDRALSGSAQGDDAHILDPVTGKPAGGRRGAWALAPTAAEADALSTAFMVMPTGAIEALCTDDRYEAIIAIEGQDPVRFGRSP